LAWHLRLPEAEFRGIVHKRVKFTQRPETLRKTVSANVKIAKRICSINKKQNRGTKESARTAALLNCGGFLSFELICQ
jgi:hypothetical protein